MARQYGQIMVSIWDDTDFTALSGSAQRLYLMLVTQKDLRPTGIIGLSERRWAKYAPDTDRETVEETLLELVRERYLIVDEDAEELLIRTFMRHDGGYRNTNLRKSIQGDYGKIHSAALRQMVAEEFKALTGGDIVPTPDKPSSKGLPKALPETLPDALPETTPEGDPDLPTDDRRQTSTSSLHPATDDDRVDNSQALSTGRSSSSEFEAALITTARAMALKSKRADDPEQYAQGIARTMRTERGDEIATMVAQGMDATEIAESISGSGALARKASRGKLGPKRELSYLERSWGAA